MTTQRSTAVATVVTGPKTRLGQALIASAPSAGATYAVARGEVDLATLDRSAATVVDGSAPTPLLDGVEAEAVRLHVCALGPVHTWTLDPDNDAAHVERDLDVVARLLDEAGDRPTHVVHVSSILALAPGADRTYYGGWKNLVEGRLAMLVDAHPRAELTVLYPGRLMAASERRRPWHLSHTTYDRLARLMHDVSAGPARSRIVGLDARAWLLARSLSLTATTLSGTRGSRRRHGGVDTAETFGRNGNR